MGTGAATAQRISQNHAYAFFGVRSPVDRERSVHQNFLGGLLRHLIPLLEFRLGDVRAVPRLKGNTSTMPAVIVAPYASISNLTRMATPKSIGAVQTQATSDTQPNRLGGTLATAFPTPKPVSKPSAARRHPVLSLERHPVLPTAAEISCSAADLSLPMVHPCD